MSRAYAAGKTWARLRRTPHATRKAGLGIIRAKHFVQPTKDTNSRDPKGIKTIFVCQVLNENSFYFGCELMYD